MITPCELVINCLHLRSGNPTPDAQRFVMRVRILHAYQKVLDVLWIRIFNRLALNWRRRSGFGFLRWRSFLCASKSSGPTFAFEQTRKRERIKVSESLFLAQPTNGHELTHSRWSINTRKQKDFSRQQISIHKRIFNWRNNLSGID